MSRKRKRHDSRLEDDDGDRRTYDEEASYEGESDRTKAYQSMDLIQHILARPDSYVGSVAESEPTPMWVVDDSGDTPRIVKKEIQYVPALLKIFDEILVNAADNKDRDQRDAGLIMKTLSVVIDQENGFISIKNDGATIPVEKKHSEGSEGELVWVPYLCFGIVLAGSSFDDTEERMIGGRNGYGAKCTNIYSSKFEVEIVDPTAKKKYTQRWTENMSAAEEPRIRSCARGKGGVTVKFWPDLGRFGQMRLRDDMVALMKRRVYDIAGLLPPEVRVSLNGTRIPANNFKKFIGLFHVKNEETGLLQPIDQTKIAEEVITDRQGKLRWHVAIVPTRDGHEHVSFVNSINTFKGGKHVDHVVRAFSKNVIDKVKKKKQEGARLTRTHVKNHIMLFLNCRIVNPTFESQSKGELTTPSKDFGSRFVASDKFLRMVISKKMGLVDLLLSYAVHRGKQTVQRLSAKKSQRLKGMQKLDDANRAGTRESHKCTLILTEGDSAKTLAVCGLSVIGRDYFGIFPLRGKPLNVRNCSADKLSKNEEITNVIKIMGLKVGVEYKTRDDLKKLRYGSVMIMADQDHDGSHIKGLLINFFDHFWPDLLQISGFLKEFITPIVSVSRRSTVRRFYTLPEYEAWKTQHEHDRGWETKYYKGLGANSAEEARGYFSNLRQHLLKFQVRDVNFREKIALAFQERNTEARKGWINSYEEGTFIDQSRGYVTYSDFIDRELILYSIYNVQRAIPSLVDGLKPGQRKILFGCFKKNLTRQMKVSQLAGYVSLHAGYHHGEKSLSDAIVKLAQTHVGSNNLNILHPCGQFGSRLLGGEDAASPRYIFTRLGDMARIVYPKQDDMVLRYLDDDGKSVEPMYYAPVVPMVLVNGCRGIGTGWATNVPNYNPADILANIRRMVRGGDPVDMKPWYRGFTGEINFKKERRYETLGSITKVNDSTLVLSELPIGVWTQKYKISVLDKMELANQIDSFDQDHTDVSVSFTIYCDPEQMAAIEAKGFQKVFKLAKTVHTSNMTLFSPEGHVKTYGNVCEILRAFYDVRLRMYGKRKQVVLRILRIELDTLKNQVRFIKQVIQQELVVRQKKRRVILRELRDLNYALHPTNEITKLIAQMSKIVVEDEDGEDEELEEEGESAVLETGYNYLLKMPLWSLTLERVRQLEAKFREKKGEVDELVQTTEVQLWTKDLEEFENAWKAYLEKDRVTREGIIEVADKRQSRSKKKAPTFTRRRRKKTPGAGSGASSASSGEESDASVVLATASRGRGRKKSRGRGGGRGRGRGGRRRGRGGGPRGGGAKKTRGRGRKKKPGAPSRRKKKPAPPAEIVISSDEDLDLPRGSLRERLQSRRDVLDFPASDDDDIIMTSNPKTKGASEPDADPAAPAAVPASAPALAPAPAPSDVSDLSSMTPSLPRRKKKTKRSYKKRRKTAPKGGIMNYFKKVKKASSSVIDLDDLDDDGDVVMGGGRPKKRKPKPSAATEIVRISSSSSSSSSESEEDALPPPRPTADADGDAVMKSRKKKKRRLKKFSSRTTTTERKDSLGGFLVGDDEDADDDFDMTLDDEEDDDEDVDFLVDENEEVDDLGITEGQSEDDDDSY